MRRGGRALTAAGSLVFALSIGCGGHSSGSTSPPPPANFELSGKAMSGQMAVTGAEVQLYVAGASGYGSGASLLAQAVFTDQSGSFLFQGTVTCPSASALTYVTAFGGHTGTQPDNAAIGLMAALGPCGDLNASTVTVNEATTVAAAWTLNAFLGTGGVVGTSAGNAQGLANAFANAASVADSSSGAIPGKAAPPNAVFPVAKIDTVADILASCVEQSSATACSALFAAVTPAGGSAPATTMDAALDLARNPGANPAALFALAAGSAPFQPILSAAPPDWILAVTYNGGGLNTPDSIGVDASGNLWVTDYFAAVSELSSNGAAISPSTGFTGGGLKESYGLAVDEGGSVWVTNELSSGVNGGDGSVTVLNASGQPVSGASGYYGGGIFFPIAAAADSNGNVWIADYGDSTASEYSMTGSPLSGTGWGSAQLSGPAAVAIDANNNAWFANQSATTGSVTSISSDGSKVNTFACGGVGPSGIATDAIAVAANGATGHVWTANYYSDSVSELALASDGTATLVGTAFTGGGLERPNGIAIDGAGNVWVTNYRGASISELAAASSAQPGAPLSPSAGFGSDASLTEPFGVAIDGSGNVWVSNQGSSTVTQFLGAATPVKTPVLGPPQLP